MSHLGLKTSETLNLLQQHFTAHDLGKITSFTSATGGCISGSFRLSTDSSQQYFIKYLSDAPAGFFAAEAEGLAALSANCSLRIPKVILHDQNFLLLEDLLPALPASNYWQNLAQGLAELHHFSAQIFGFTNDNFCGRTTQINPVTEDGYQFFSEARLHFQARMAFQANRLTTNDLKQIEQLCDRLSQWIPAQQATLLHGDLWSGNVLSDHYGKPALIDPACYWGWAETDIAMTQLFGGFPPSFYDTYLHYHPLENGWQERMALYNLYHLLNHLNLFGGSYLTQVRRILKRYLG